jgi:hypothetical protein
MSGPLKYLIAACIFLVVVASASINGASEGFVEGRLKIVLQKPVRLDDENTPTLAAKNYTDYPLIILSQAERKQIARITPDADGNYRAALPPGAYILDVEGRVPKRLRVRAQPFTVLSNETVHLDMTIVTGFGAEVGRSQE